MSIIFDALKKTQQSRETHETSETSLPTQQSKRRLPVLKISLWLGSVSLLTALAIIIDIPRQIRHFTTPPPPPPRPQPVVKPPVKLTLNGVFLSDHDKIAMINKQLFHIGDTINGMRVISIDMQNVTLQGPDSRETLTTENLT